MSLPDEAMKLKDGKIIYDQLASMVAVQYSEAESNPAGSYVIYNGSVYLLPNGHTANTSWANTEKEGPTNIGGKLSSLKTQINSMPTEETGQELLAAEFHNTGLTDTAVMVLGMILNAMPQDDIATDIVHSISLECERLDAIYENWMSERSA